MWAARAVGEGCTGLGGGWRSSAHVASSLELHPLLHEVLEGGEVALLRRLEKSLLLLQAQPSALSASREPGWGQGWGWVRVRVRARARLGLGLGLGQGFGLGLGLGLGLRLGLGI